MNLTSFYSKSEIPRNKNRSQGLFHLGQDDPRSLTRGAQGPLAGHAGQWPGKPRPWRGSYRWPLRWRSGAGKRRGRGPGGPLAHQEVAAGVSSAGGGPMVAESTAAAADICGGIGDGVGDSRRLGSIPRTGRARRRWRSFPARRWRLGRCGTAALPSGHGAAQVY
jgi:hypothetical protein